MYIGLLSDTHGTFDKPFRDFLEPVDEIWHAGDFGNFETFGVISAFKPLKGVYGNCDGQELRYDNPLFRFFDCEGMTILMTHIGGYPGRYDRRAYSLIKEYKPNIFICGHSHILKVINDKENDLLAINPGAAGIYGFHSIRTALRFHIDKGNIHDMEVYNLPKTNGNIL